MTRKCRHCRTPLPKLSYYLSPENERRRKFCSQVCNLAASRARILRLVKPGERKRDQVPPSPHRVETWAEVPPRCGRCDGLWRHVRGGVCCRGCGRDTYVQEALQPLVALEAGEEREESAIV